MSLPNTYEVTMAIISRSNCSVTDLFVTQTVSAITVLFIVFLDPTFTITSNSEVTFTKARRNLGTTTELTAWCLLTVPHGRYLTRIYPRISLGICFSLFTSGSDFVVVFAYFISKVIMI